MALSQLLQRRSTSFCHRNGFQRPARLFSLLLSDTESEKPSKNTGMSKEPRAEAMDSFVKKYMDTNSGIFPKPTHIQNEIGRSWYIVKETLHRMREKMLGVPPPDNDRSLTDLDPALACTAFNSNLSDQPDSGAQTYLPVTESVDENTRHATNDAPAKSPSDLLTDATASDVTNKHDSSGSCDLHVASVLLSGKSEKVSRGEDTSANGIPDSEAQKDFVITSQRLDESIRHATNNALAESSFYLVADAVASNITNKHDSSLSGSCELHTASVLLSANSEKVSGGEDASANGITLVSGSQTEGTVELNAVSDSLHLENEVHSNMCKSSGRTLALDSAKLSISEHGKVNHTGSGDQQENKELTSSLFLKLCSDMTDKSALLRSSETVSCLADLFRNNMDNPAITESKSGHRQLDGVKSHTFWSSGERNSRVNQFFSDRFSSSESPSNMQVTDLNKSVFTKHESHPPDEEMAFSNRTQSVVSKGMDPFTTINNQASEVMSNIKSDILGHFEGHKEKDGAKSIGIKDLIECLKKLPQPSTTRSQGNTPTCNNDGISNRGLSWGAESPANLPDFGKKGRKVSERAAFCGKPEDDGPGNMNIDNDTASRPEFAVPDLVKSLRTTKKDTMKDKLSLSKKFDQNKAIVKFLRLVEESEIYKAFQDCGDISKIEISNVKGAFYQVAYVYFRTREGLKRALEKTDLCVGNSFPTVEAADLIEDISNRISIPSLIGDPDVPAKLVKNPTRTVMIGKLTHDISSHHIEAALTCCGSNLTGFFLGSSNSVAYVEFETEEGKENALVQRSIDVLGKQLLISRIDVPRTTVVRVSVHHSVDRCHVINTCRSFGKVRATRKRYLGLLDVYYGTAEWPNMLNILNRLNKTEVDGRPLLAQPAPVIPPDILHVLWHQPEERKHVEAILQKLLYKVGQNPISADLLDLMDSFYRDKS